MLLAIDIGNTNIVIGCIEAEKICHELRLATDLVKTSDQYWMDLKGVLALYDLQADEIEGVIISSVVPPVLNSLRTAVMKLTGRTPMVVGPGLKTGLNIAGGNAGQVGSDLVVAAVSALGYDAYMTMVTALESLDGTKDVLTSVDLRNALYEVDYEGVTGDISFDDNGDAIRDTAYLKQIQNGKFVFLKKQVDETE